MSKQHHAQIAGIEHQKWKTALQKMGKEPKQKIWRRNDEQELR